MQRMVAITKTYLQSLYRLPKDIQKKANETLEKFRFNCDDASLNYEKIKRMRDDKVRTIRVTQKYRCIVISPDDGNNYIFVYVDNHDEAMDWARNKVFDINDRTSAIQVLDMDLLENFEEEYVDNDLSLEQLSHVEEKKTIIDNYSAEELIDIGIPKELIPSLKLVKDEDSLKSIKDYIDDTTYEILEFCLEGFSVEEIKELFKHEPLKENDTFADVINKNVNRNYIRLVTDDVDVKSVLDNPIDSWRIFLHPTQKKLVEGNNGNYRGSFQVKGSAGTGKTVVAMHRTKYLAQNVYKSRGDKVLYTTYSNKLPKSVEHNLKNMCSIDVLKRIDVKNLYSLVATYLRERGINFNIISDSDRKEFLSKAIEICGLSDYYTYRDIRREIDVVFKFYQIEDRRTYLRVSRNGTYKKYGKNQRNDIWDIYLEYLNLLEIAGVKEWWMLFADATKMIKKEGYSPYKAIVIDEAQDFSMPEYRFIRALVPQKENDLFIVGDIRQKIYNGKVNFSKCGINIQGKRTNKLVLNYRNTLEISNMADKVILGEEFCDLDGTIIKASMAKAILNGEEPVIKSLSSFEEEAAYVESKINELMSRGMLANEIAIISRKNKVLNDMYSILSAKGFKLRPLKEVDSIDNSIYYGTMHSIKGFEFKAVFIISANDENIMAKSVMERFTDERETNEFIRSEKSLIYVAITRARDMVYITGSPTVSSYINI